MDVGRKQAKEDREGNKNCQIVDQIIKRIEYVEYVNCGAKCGNMKMGKSIIQILVNLRRINSWYYGILFKNVILVG